MASPKEIRVIQLIDNLEPGGAERMAVTIANGLLDENLDKLWIDQIQRFSRFVGVRKLVDL